jgi:hypothetical protein
MATIWQIYDTGVTSAEANTPFWILILMVGPHWPAVDPRQWLVESLRVLTDKYCPYQIPTVPCLR